MCSLVRIKSVSPFVGETTIWSGIHYHSTKKNFTVSKDLFTLNISINSFSFPIHHSFCQMANQGWWYSNLTCLFSTKLIVRNLPSWPYAVTIQHYFVIWEQHIILMHIWLGQKYVENDLHIGRSLTNKT